MAFNYADRKQQDKNWDKAANVAQKWMQRGFTPKQVAEGITNKIGYQTGVTEAGAVQIWACYNGEYGKKSFYVVREITEAEIKRSTNG